MPVKDIIILYNVQCRSWSFFRQRAPVCTVISSSYWKQVLGRNTYTIAKTSVTKLAEKLNYTDIHNLSRELSWTLS